MWIYTSAETRWNSSRILNIPDLNQQGSTLQNGPRSLFVLLFPFQIQDDLQADYGGRWSVFIVSGLSYEYAFVVWNFNFMQAQVTTETYSRHVVVWNIWSRHSSSIPEFHNVFTLKTNKNFWNVTSPTFSTVQIFLTPEDWTHHKFKCCRKISAAAFLCSD